MTQEAKRSSSGLRAAMRVLGEVDTLGPLDELADALVLASGFVARAKRRPGGPDLASDLGKLDETFSRAITLTRELRERLLARRSRGEFASMSHAAREVVEQLHDCLLDGVSLSVRCPSSPAVVAVDGAQLRHLVGSMVEGALDAIGPPGGRVEVEVVEGVAVNDEGRVVMLDVKTSGALADVEPLMARLRPIAHAVGAQLHVRSVARLGAVFSVRIAGAC